MLRLMYKMKKIGRVRVETKPNGHIEIYVYRVAQKK